MWVLVAKKMWPVFGLPEQDELGKDRVPFAAGKDLEFRRRVSWVTLKDWNSEPT